MTAIGTLRSTKRHAGAPLGPRDRDLRSQAILEVALSLFEAKGVGATSIDDIIQHAGIAKGTFYHYFCDRSALLDEIQARLTRDIAEKTQVSMDIFDQDEVGRKLNAWVSSVFQGYTARYSIFVSLCAHQPRLERGSNDELIVEKLSSVIERGNLDGIWYADAPTEISLCMLYIIRGYCLDTTRGQPSPQAIDFLSKLLRRMIGVCE